MESVRGAVPKIDYHFGILLYSHIQSDVILHLSSQRLVNTIKYPSFDRRIANLIATTNNDNDQIRSRIPARTRFGGFAVSAMLLLSGLVLATQINQPAMAGTFPGPNGQIAFDSDRDTPPDQEGMRIPIVRYT